MGTHTTKLADHLVRYRWLFVVPLVLPLLLAFNLFWALRGFYQRGWRCAPEAHERRVCDIHHSCSILRALTILVGRTACGQPVDFAQKRRTCGALVDGKQRPPTSGPH
jgi:hypothetical protein